MRRVIAGAGALLVLLLLPPSAGRAADPGLATITSSGPLTQVIVTTDLNCQVAHAGDSGFEFYDPNTPAGACGTLLFLDGTLYGPTNLPSAPLATEPWTSVTQSAVTGAGTDADPLRVVTIVDAGSTGVRVEESDSYVIGHESYRTDIRITNRSGGEHRGTLYRAGDCYLQDSDVGYGRLDGPAPACVVSQQQGSRLEQWLPLTAGSAAMENEYGTVWTAVAAGQILPGSCLCDTQVDNAAAISWAVSIPGGGEQTFSHLTVFSPEGRRPLTTQLVADAPTATPGGRDGYTLTFQNANTAAVQLDSVFALLPPAFRYSAGSTRGVVSGDPQITTDAATQGQRLTWPGPVAVPGTSIASLHFDVAAGLARGAFRASAGAASATETISGAEQTATISIDQAAAVPIRQSVPSPLSISLDPVVIAQSAAIAVGVVALVPFPSALFNSTLEQHYDEVMAPILRLREVVGPIFSPVAVMWGAFRRFPTRRRRGSGAQTAAGADASTGGDAAGRDGATAVALTDPMPFFATPIGIVVFIVLSAVLYGLLDPNFGFNAPSVGTFAGILGGLVITLLMFGIPYARALGRDGIRTLPRALPGTLLVGLGCVVISRLANFQPGYLYGLIVGFVLSRHLTHAEEGRGLAIATASALVGALVAWVLLIVVRAASPPGPSNPGFDDPNFLAAILETACVTVVVAGLETAVFGLLPIRFLPGEKVLAYHRVLWIVLLAAGTFVFCHVILNPSSGYLADTTRVSLATTVALLAFFGLGSVAFWGFFRYRARRAGHGVLPDEPPLAPGPPV